MKTLFDVTGLHSAVSPFLKEEISEIDLYGMIQLCISTIFFDEILIDNRKEKSEVSNFTDQAIDKLVTLGFDKGIIGFTDFSKKDYDELYETGAKELSNEINWLFSTKETDLRGLYPEGLNKDYLKMGSEFSRIAANSSGNIFEDIIGNWESKKTTELADYLVAISPELRESIIYFNENNPNITNEQFFQLNIFMRYRLNELFSLNKGATHTPSVARAKLVLGGEKFLIKKVENKLDKLTSEIKGVGMLMPSIMDYLLQNSRGDIDRLLALTIEFREKAKPLRELIGETLSTCDINQPEGKHQLDKKLDELIEIVRQDLGVDTPQFKDVLQFTLSSWVFFDIDQNKLIDWIKYRKNRKRVSVLTEVSKFAIYNDNLNQNYELMKMFRR